MTSAEAAQRKPRFQKRGHRRTGRCILQSVKRSLGWHDTWADKGRAEGLRLYEELKRGKAKHAPQEHQPSRRGRDEGK